MFTRSRKKFVAWIALVALIFAAWVPATPAFARAPWNADFATLGALCSSYAPGDPAAPAGPGVLHGHCASCANGAPLVFALPVDVLLATVDAPASAPRMHRNATLPRDRVALHPLSPQAPPRAV
jgi:hypothetical protein